MRKFSCKMDFANEVDIGAWDTKEFAVIDVADGDICDIFGWVETNPFGFGEVYRAWVWDVGRICNVQVASIQALAQL